MEKIIIDRKVTVEMEYTWGDKPSDKIVLTKEIEVGCEHSNTSVEVEITLNRTDALKLVEFIQANLDKLNDD